ncbi:MAG: CU044_2847 family protein [Chloroflexota bacterium]
MKQWIEFPLEDGSSLTVEVDVPERAGMVRAGWGEEVAQRAQQTFEAALEKVRPAAQPIIQKLRAQYATSDEIEVQVDGKMDADLETIIAAAGMEGNYIITLRWKRE